MGGLIYKDFCLIKTTGKLLLLMIAVFGITGIAQGQASFFTSMITMMMLILPINCFSYDQMAGWDVFAASSSISRKKTVAARYIVILLMAAISLALSTLFGWCTSLLHPEISLMENVISAVSALTVGLIMVGVMLPIVYKFGVEKSRIAMMLIFLIPFAAILLLGQLATIGTMSLPSIPERTVELAVYLAVPAALLLYGLSYLLSSSIYSRKEL